MAEHAEHAEPGAHEENYLRERPPLIDVSLAEVYRIDFEARREDLPTWIQLGRAAAPGPICEIGSGFGRVARHLLGFGPVWGIEPDHRMVYGSREIGVSAMRGAAEDPAAWQHIPTGCRLIFCAYSTLFLMEHAAQERALRMARAHLAAGGVLAVETFVPSAAPPANGERIVQNPSDSLDAPPWVRRTTYAPGRVPQSTIATRLYGPRPEDWRLQLVETIWWRTPAQVVDLFATAGMHGVAQYPADGPDLPVAPGHVVTVWRAP